MSDQEAIKSRQNDGGVKEAHKFDGCYSLPEHP